MIDLFSIPREAEGVACPCGGYADIVETTDEEEVRFGCGHKGCCARAFVCRICKKRLSGAAEAPEMD